MVAWDDQVPPNELVGKHCFSSNQKTATSSLQPATPSVAVALKASFDPFHPGVRLHPCTALSNIPAKSIAKPVIIYYPISYLEGSWGPKGSKSLKGGHNDFSTEANTIHHQCWTGTFKGQSRTVSFPIRTDFTLVKKPEIPLT